MASQKQLQELLDDKEAVLNLSRKTKILISILGSLLPVFFGFLKLKGASLVHFSDDAGANFILKCTLVLYYTSWAFGTLSDVSDLEIAFIRVPRSGRIPWHAILIASTLTGVFAILCIVRTAEQFVLFLTIFWFYDHVSLIYLVRFIVKPAYDSSKKVYNKTRSWHRLELLKITYDYVAGGWSKLRCLLGLVGLLIINLLTFTFIGPIVTNRLTYSSLNFTIALAVLCFIIVVEVWIWAMRIRTKMSQHLYNRLLEKYRLVRKSRGQHHAKSGG